MKNDELFEALSYIDPKLIEEAKPQVMRRKSSRLLAPIAAVLVLAIVLGLFFGRWNPFKSELPAASETPNDASSQGSPASSEVSAPSASSEVSASSSQASEPPASSSEASASSLPSGRPVQTLAFTPYPAQSHGLGLADDSLDPFLKETIAQFLSGAGGENRVYSPMSLYFALAAAARCAEGETRQQILDLLGAASAEDLLSDAKDLWEKDYFIIDEPGNMRKTLFASSLWFSDDLNPDEALLAALSEDLYLSAYACEMGTQETSEAFRQWLSDNTGGALDEHFAGFEFTKDDRFAIAATVDFFAKWAISPNGFLTGKSLFHGAAGDVFCDYLHSVWSGSNTVFFWGEKFTALSMQLEANQGEMLLILPDKGYTTEDLLADDAALELILNGARASRGMNQIEGSGRGFSFTRAVSYLSIPKFDISSDLDLSSGLQALGVTDCFSESADFSPVMGDDFAAISKVDHAVRVAIDEEGVTAAAATVMVAAVGILQRPPETVYFNVDRPFLFVITGKSGLPLFVGEVNRLEGSADAQPENGASFCEKIGSIRIEEQDQPDYELTEEERETFLRFLKSLPLEDANGLAETNMRIDAQTVVLTETGGTVHELSFAFYYPDPENIREFVPVIRIDGSNYRGPEGRESAPIVLRNAMRNLLEKEGRVLPLYY